MIDRNLIDVINKHLREALQHDPARLEHVYAVRDMALKISRHYGCDQQKTEVAALLHDMTKTYSNEENRLLAGNMLCDDVPEDCYHAYAASAIAKRRYKIHDDDILNAIKYHCSGRKNMSLLEKIIYVSDFIEINRDFVTEKLREGALTNLDLTVYLIMKQTKSYLEKTNKKIARLTVEAIEDYQKRFGGIE